jgi:26S proteasome regulatory subunit N3
MKLTEKEEAAKKEAAAAAALVAAAAAAKTEVKENKDADTLTFEDIRENVKHIERGIQTKETRHLIRVMRNIFSTRKRLNDPVLKRLINYYFITPNVQSDKEFLQSFIDLNATSTTAPATTSVAPMETDDQSPTLKTEPSTTSSTPVPISTASVTISTTTTATPATQKAKLPSIVLPEVDLYLHLLVLLFAIDKQKYKQAIDLAEKMMDKINCQNRRSLDIIAAKCYFYYSRTYELNGKLDKIRYFLHSRLRTAILRNDFEGTAVLINILLRSYLQYNLYDQALKLVSKSTFPIQASNNEWARYFFYYGRIKAIQLEYTEASKNLTQALRKAPQSEAVGFKQIVQKFSIVVELLLGEIPDKATFRNPQLHKALQPYFQLTQAVRTGHLAKFNQVVEKFSDQFIKENTWTLIIRLRHNVIKTGVKMMSLSYSKISLDNIAQKLQLDSAVDAEFIVAKAIRDGVIEAHIDHENGFVQTKDLTDVYSTLEPMRTFNQRIKFCLELRNQSVKAMRFPPKKYSEELETPEERRAREEEELEYAKEMADEEDDSYG